MLPYAPEVRPQPGPLSLAVLSGALAVASLPVVLAYPGAVVGYLLTLAGGLAVAAVGQALRVPALRVGGLVATGLGAAAAAFGIGAVLVLGLVLAPLAVIVVVGDALRRTDPSAPTPLLAASAIAIAAGFAGAVASPPLVVGITVLVLVGGSAATLARLRDDAATPDAHRGGAAGT